MGDAKYISVIHTPTDKIVTAFKFQHDATWIGKEKDELMATANYCEQGAKVKMIFVKSFERDDGVPIHAYFRSAPNQVGLRENLSGESSSHRKAKENVYDGVYSGEIKINGEVLDKQKIDDIYIEYRTSKNGYVIPDILIKFKEEHIKYGYGIFIEIQLSKQNEEETLLRTYYRVIEGFSGIWLWENDFDKDMNLLNKDLEIKSHRQLLSELDKNIENNFINRINNYGQIIDKKIVDSKNDIWIYCEKSKESFNGEIEYISKNVINKLDVENSKLEDLRQLADSLDSNSWKRQDIDFKEFTEELICKGKTEIEKSIINILDKNIEQMKKFCPNCNKPMKIGKAMGGYNWYCPDFPLKCDGLIKDVNFHED